MCRVIQRVPADQQHCVPWARGFGEGTKAMSDATRIGRVRLVAVGLGVAAALAAIPGRASADDIQISFDGMDLFPTAGNTAEAFSGTNDIAIAIGAGSSACAGSAAVPCADSPGEFDSAFADGTSSTADSGEGKFDFASANGDGSTAGAGYGNFDAALANGDGSGADASGDVLNNTTLLSGNDDFASAWGPNTIAAAGDLLNVTPSSDDVALVFDPFGTAGSDAYAGIGNFDLGAVFGDMLTANAFGGNYLLDILPSL
jgi:hypothetical protein